MRIALCNEVLQPMPFARQCEYAAALGYAGLEVAPFTLGDDALRLSARERGELRRAAADAGIAVSGLHWLLAPTPDLSVTDPDADVRARTRDRLCGLIDLCAELGGTIMVHGSPAQRRLPEGPAPEGDAARQAAIDTATDTFAVLARHAERAGVVYCIEPLAPPGANFIHRVDEAADIVRAIGSPALRTMLDCYAASRTEAESPADVLDRWLPSGLVAHIQVNDPSGRGPGQGELMLRPVLQALERHAYDGWIAVEPFDYLPDGPGCAARAIGYLSGVLEGMP
ncbi:MAG: sugar phosphate isomerase/epimerase [Gammaproteobacteria bacterium]|nr:sugar phosphate isomerase/epimerase [Gammaproteobacteria bacterium]MBU1440088.1 sugar phosphate isomerase/epimerase [Gammaproteobacteria bacterium]